MSLKAVLDSLDGLSEDVKNHYRKGEDGKFYLSVDAVSGWALENVANLKTAYEKTKENLRIAEGSLKKFGDLDPDAARSAIQKLDEIKDLPSKDKIDEVVKAKVAEFKEKMEGDSKKLRESLETEVGLHKKTIQRNLALAAINSAKGNAKLLLPHVLDAIKVDKDDKGEYVARVIDPISGIGKVTNKSGSTDAMSVEEFVETLKSVPDFQACFEGTHHSGGGASGGNAARGNSEFTISEQDAKDVAKYRAANAAAEKAGKPLQMIGQ